MISGSEVILQSGSASGRRSVTLLKQWVLVRTLMINKCMENNTAFCHATNCIFVTIYNNSLMCFLKWHFSQCIGPWGARKSRCLRLQKIQIQWTWMKWICQRRNRLNRHCHPVRDCFSWLFTILQLFVSYCNVSVSQMIFGITGFAGLVKLPQAFYRSSGTMKYKCIFSVALFFVFVCKCMHSIYRGKIQNWPLCLTLTLSVFVCFVER